MRARILSAVHAFEGRLAAKRGARAGLLRLLVAAVTAATLVFTVAASADPDPLGTVTEFSSGMNPSAGLVVGIVSGSDGNLWFADKGSSGPTVTPTLGMINPATGAISEFSIAGNGGNADALPANSLAAGPDGNIWFTDQGSGATPIPAVGLINPITDKVSEFSTGLAAGSVPFGISAGSDGNVWFSDRSTTKPAIGVIDPISHAITEYDIGPVSTPGDHGGNVGSAPSSVVGAPGGNVWFSDIGATPAIGLICLKVGPLCSASAVASHAVSEFSSNLNKGSAPGGLAAGPDGSIWFVDNGKIKAIGKINPASGVITEFSSLTPTVLSGDGTNALTLSETATASGTVTLTFSTSVTIGITSGSSTATVSSGSFAANVLVGMKIVGTNIPSGTTVVSVNGGTLTMSNAATSTNSALSTSFLTSIANVTTTAGSTSVNVSQGVFPIVTGDTVSGPGIPVGILNPGAVLSRITAGPDGNMWFNDAGTGVSPATPAIGMINPTTDKITDFTQPAGMNAGSNPHGITVGPDGNLWFPDTGTPKAIGKFGVGAPAASVTPPSVTGTDGVGVPQACGGDVWSSWAGMQPSHDAYGYDGYEWLLDGSPIAGATGTSYTPSVAEAGHQLSCKVTVTYTLFPTTVSATSAAVTVKGASAQLIDLGAAVAGVGPGQSLAGKVAAVQGYVAASDTADACDTLAAFINEVNAQTGKKLSATQAASFGTQAQDIEAALGC